MAISVRSTLSENERIFIIAVDHCGADGVDGVLYHSGAQNGWYFNGFLEMTEMVEQEFQQMRYPGEVLKKRFFGKRRNRTEMSGFPVCAEPAECREGQITTYLLRVKQRQYASWQGTLVDQKSGKRYGFRSFLELVKILDLLTGGPNNRKPDGAGQIIHRYLPLSLKDNKSAVCVNEILPGIAICQHCCEGRKNTFLVKLMFHENYTCQGILCWKERRCQQSFRSFLELTQLIGEAVYDEMCDEENWEESVG